MKKIRFRIYNRYYLMGLNDIVGILIPIILWTIASFSPIKTDTDGYKNMYYDTSGDNTYGIEHGFYYLIRIARIVGLNYWAFRAILIAFSFVLIGRAIRKVETNTSVFWLFYGVFPLFFDLIQLRFFFGFSILVYAVSFALTHEKKVITYIIYVMLVGVASLFHVAILLYVVYLLPLLLDGKKFYIIIGTIAVAEIALIGFLPSIIKQYVLLLRSQVTYYKYSVSYGSNLLFPLTYIIILFLCFFIERVGEKERHITPEFDDGVAVKLKKICLTSIVLVNFVLININFSRYYRNAIVFALIAFARKKIKFNRSVSKMIMWIAFLGILLLLMNNFGIIDFWSDSFMGIDGFEELFKKR